MIAADSSSTSPEQALRDADARMYADKRERCETVNRFRARTEALRAGV